MLKVQTRNLSQRIQGPRQTPQEVQQMPGGGDVQAPGQIKDGMHTRERAEVDQKILTGGNRGRGKAKDPGRMNWRCTIMMK